MTVSCTGSTLSGPATQTNVADQPVISNITSISFTGCTRGTTNCTVVQSGSGNGTLTLEGSTLTGTILLGSKTITWNNGCWLGQTQNCVWTNLPGGIVGAWSNVTSALTISPTANNVTSSNCGLNAMFSGTYTWKNTTPAGAPTLKVVDN